LQNQRTRRQNRSCLGVGTSGRGEDIREGYKRVNMVEILCSYIYKYIYIYTNIYIYTHTNGKMRPVETIPGMGVGDKGECWSW
jgi:hypothetical protein